MLSVGSLFAGIGGFDLGFERCGMHTAWQVELDPYCRAVLARHFPGAERFEDIREVGAMPASKITKQQLTNAIAAYGAGQSVAEIADHLPITRQALWERLKRAGVPMRSRQRHGVENHFYRGGPKGADWAHNKVEKAIVRGELLRPEICEGCGGEGESYRGGRSPIQAHHDDYNKPLKVRWLCQRCHHEWHKLNEPIPLTKGVVPDGSLAPVDLICGGFP